MDHTVSQVVINHTNCLPLKFEGFVDMTNGTFIDEISELLQSSHASNAKGKSIFEVDLSIIPETLLLETLKRTSTMFLLFSSSFARV